MTDESFDTLGDLPTIEGSDGGESKMLAGRYRIIRKLGEGGMGLVYLAEDTDLGNERVAIKFIPPTLANNERAIKNLKKEAQTARQLSHPNIVRLHDLHTDGHQKFLVMEYIDGKTLEQALAEKESDKFTLEELLPIAEQIAAGLDYAHKRKVLHRDLKPSNIMIAKDSTVKLLDFGIAREMKDSYTRVTGKETSGTLPYMSPDQLMGEPPTVAMDVYSFGAVLYECLSGHPPFYMGDIREQIKSKIPADLSDVETSVNNAIQSALAKSSDQRPENTSDLVKMLKGKKKAPDIKDTLDYAQTINIKVEEQKARKKKVKIFAAVIVFVLLVISGYAVFRYTTEQKHGLKTDSEKPQQKRDIFDQIAAEQEQSFRNLIEAAFICEAKEDWEKAIEGYSKALAIKPDDAEVKDKLATCQHNLYLAKAESAEAQRDLDSAIDNYTKALSYKQVASTQMKLDTAKKTLQAKIETEHKKREYDKWIAQAQESEKEGDLTAAVKFYQKAQSYTDGSLQSKIDSLNTQIAEAEKLKKFNELLTFAKANDNKANGKEALKVLAEALALYPDNSEALALQ
jgi:serine/threonine protein kinase